MIDEFLQLPVFPNNYIDQIIFFEMLKTAAQNATNFALANNSGVAQVSSASEPNQAQWEAAWVAKGYALPIPPSAILIWWNSTSNIVGGQYGTTPTSAGTVYSRDTRNPRGGTNFYDVVELSAAVASTVSIGVANTNHPSLTFTLEVLSDLILTYALSVDITVGTGEFGGDFLLDGIKVGTNLHALPANIGISNAAFGGPLYVEARVPNVAPGSHTVQAIMGVIKSPITPPTLAYGGLTAYGIRTLTIRAITL